MTSTDRAEASSTPADVNSTPPDTGAVEPHRSATSPVRRDALRAAAILLVVLVTCVVGYLAATVPGAWFPHVSPAAWNVKNVGLVRGAGSIEGNELVVSATDENGIALVNVTTDFRASDYAGVAWVVAGLADNADVRLLWRTDFQPNKLNALPLQVQSGDTRTAVLAGNAAWIGRVTGLALAYHGTLAQPLRIRGVIAKPMGVSDIARDRLRQWFAFERWNGTSINTIVGGVDYQDVFLPAAIALAVGLSGAATVLIRRWRPRAFGVTGPALLAGLFVAGWVMLDARWAWNMVRQERATAIEFAGKSPHDKLLANDDGPLFAFIDKALAILPKTPVRIFIAADADYFRGRAAYHLYPYRVFYDPRSNVLPPPTDFRPGDWLLVFQRRGIQFDRAQGKIRWNGSETVNAELKLVEPGAALFVIR